MNRASWFFAQSAYGGLPGRAMPEIESVLRLLGER
jgi:hypothetical protein